ncbi:phenylacetate--CoA ligase family protein [Oceanicoccus sagamiensis]|uniref:Capsule biosynthesis protein CapK n=1 Tax=Oceanicoccus sagamiensis TaxID=716816 RepID=A0A1X9NEY3_9GAMM|nr:phenylacetate--CoA ligase family protein [Oceanicoccus sagamiensis]ARN74099.1 hypothetical protein BST96_08165 [Oceanicoccus sagamiensis]
MSTLDNLYQKMPAFIQTLMCSGYGFLLKRRRYNKEYFRIEKEYVDRDFYSSEQLQAFSWDELKKLVIFAQNHVPYYKKHFEKTGISADQINSPEDFARCIPVLTKAEVQANLADFSPDTLDEMETMEVKTSGTTGTGLVFPVTIDADRRQWALWWRYRMRFGIDHSTWYAHFYGKSVVPLSQDKPSFWRINYPGRQILFSAYHMQEDNMEAYVDALNHYKPLWIQGYPSLLVLIAEAVIQHGGLTYQPEVVTIGAESLLPHQKHIIEQAFGVGCRQHYGLTEMAANISECPEGNLHVDEDFAHVEFLDDGNGMYDIVSTGFVNKAFVLLRYKTGDTASLPTGNASCSCGRAGRLVTDIDGRIEDYIVTPDGRKIGRLDHIVKDMVNIKECQIIQNAPDKITFNVVKGGSYKQADEQRLIVETKNRIGDLIDITINYTESLTRSKTGKLRFVVSELKDNQQTL